MKVYHQFKIAAIAVLVLGIIHICATPIVLKLFGVLNFRSLLTFGYMFVMVGIATIFLGWTQIFTLKHISNHPKFLIILKATIIVISISGVGAVVTMWNNPFAYLILLIALYEVYLLRKMHENPA